MTKRKIKPRGKPIKVRTFANIKAASDYRDSVLDKADGTMNGYPAWHGWVIVEAYLAGLKAARQLKRGHK